MALIGEEFEDFDKALNILGVVLSIRSKRNVLEIWIRDGSDEKLRIAVGEKLREAVQLNPENLTLHFKIHSKSLAVPFFSIFP